MFGKRQKKVNQTKADAVKKSLSRHTGAAAAALYKRLEMENPTCQVSGPSNPSAIVSCCVLSCPSNATRGPASLPEIWLQYVLNIPGYTLAASADPPMIPASMLTRHLPSPCPDPTAHLPCDTRR